MNYRNDGKGDSNILQNQFTSYLQVALRHRKREYLEALDQRHGRELPLEDAAPPAAFKALEDSEEMSYEFQIQNEALLQALANLTDRERLILLAHVLEEIDFESLAHKHNLTYKAVTSIYYRLCEKIRKRMGGDKT